jgi:hypothetical protein
MKTADNESVGIVSIMKILGPKPSSCPDCVGMKSPGRGVPEGDEMNASGPAAVGYPIQTGARRGPKNSAALRDGCHVAVLAP